MENNIDKSDENPKFSHKSSRSWIGRGVPCRPPVRATRRADANRSFLTGGGNRQRKAIPAHYSDGAHKSLRGQPRRRRLQKVPRRVYYDSERSGASRDGDGRKAGRARRSRVRGGRLRTRSRTEDGGLWRKTANGAFV